MPPRKLIDFVEPTMLPRPEKLAQCSNLTEPTMNNELQPLGKVEPNARVRDASRVNKIVRPRPKPFTHLDAGPLSGGSVQPLGKVEPKRVRDASRANLMIGSGMSAPLLKEFIDLSYRGNTSIAPAGYSIDAPLSDSRVKVYAKNGSNDKDIVVTHRGSVGVDDWLDNASYMFRGKVKGTKTYNLHRDRHKRAIDKYGAKNIIAIGHSRAGLYLQELQKEFPIKENITYNKASGFHDIGRQNADNQTDVRVGNDVVSLLAPLQRRQNKLVKIDGTKNPFDFNAAHQTSEIDKVGDQFIGKQEGSGRTKGSKNKVKEPKKEEPKAKEPKAKEERITLMGFNLHHLGNYYYDTDNNMYYPPVDIGYGEIRSRPQIVGKVISHGYYEEGGIYRLAVLEFFNKRKNVPKNVKFYNKNGREVLEFNDYEAFYKKYPEKLDELKKYYIEVGKKYIRNARMKYKKEGSGRPKGSKNKVKEPKAEEPKAEEPKAEEPKAEEPNKVEPKKVKLAPLQEIPNFKPKKEEPKKAEPKKAEPKKAEPKNYFYDLPQDLQNEIQSKNVKDVNIFVTEDSIAHSGAVRSYKIDSIGNAFRSINGKVFWVGIKNIVAKKTGQPGAPYRVVVNEFKPPRAVPSNFRFYKMFGPDGRQFTMGRNKGFENFPITQFNELQKKSIEPIMTERNYFNEFNKKKTKTTGSGTLPVISSVEGIKRLIATEQARLRKIKKGYSYESPTMTKEKLEEKIARLKERLKSAKANNGHADVSYFIPKSIKWLKIMVDETRIGSDAYNKELLEAIKKLLAELSGKKPTAANKKKTATLEEDQAELEKIIGKKRTPDANKPAPVIIPPSSLTNERGAIRAAVQRQKTYNKIIDDKQQEDYKVILKAMIPDQPLGKVEPNERVRDASRKERAREAARRQRARDKPSGFTQAQEYNKATKQRQTKAKEYGLPTREYTASLKQEAKLKAIEEGLQDEEKKKVIREERNKLRAKYTYLDEIMNSDNTDANIANAASMGAPPELVEAEVEPPLAGSGMYGGSMCGGGSKYILTPKTEEYNLLRK